MSPKDIYISNGVLTVSDHDDDYKIMVDGKEWLFEFDSMWGPRAITKRGRDLRMTNKFLTAVSLWRQQGERVGEDGYALYDLPNPADALKGYIRVGKRTWASEHGQANRLQKNRD